jgi:serine/threonine protein kinase
VFDEAIELSAAGRPAFVAAACAGDPECQREVEVMLQLAEQTGVTAALVGAMAKSVVSRPAMTPGQTVSQYDLIEQLGGGGMGVVYKALDRRLQRHVALKFLPPYLGSEKELKARFLREAKTIASLDHPNICALLGVEEAEHGQLFMVMPCYQGETLKQKIARGKLQLEQAIDYTAQIAAGLAHAHAAGVVHRDIKPANIIVTAGDQIRILDFGVAKLSGGTMTEPGAVLGTLSYMSPEQACGDPVDHRTDLWALGVVLYEMLVGSPPFRADTPEALFFALQHRDPPSVRTLRPETPDGLAAIVKRLLEKNPARRYGHAQEVARQLTAISYRLTANS